MYITQSHNLIHTQSMME